jgi:hypothetical protein
MVRVHHAHPDRLPQGPRTFGPLNRFDPHVRDRHRRPRDQPDGRGVNYLAETLGCALAEAFADQWPEVAICRRWLAVLAAPRSPAMLLDLTGDAAMRNRRARDPRLGLREMPWFVARWGRAIYEDLATLDGIRYRAAHQGGIAIAVWERAGVLELHPGTPTSGDDGWPGARGDALLDPFMPERAEVVLAAQDRHLQAISSHDCPYCPE